MIEHIFETRTLYRIKPNEGLFCRASEPWLVQKWRWYWPFWVTILRSSTEKIATDYLAAIQTHIQYYEL